jgi:hypothetical protein
MPASASPFVAERIGGPIVKTSLFQNRTGVVALAVLCCLLWGSAYPAVKSLNRAMPCWILWRRICRAKSCLQACGSP